MGGDEVVSSRARFDISDSLSPNGANTNAGGRERIDSISACWSETNRNRGWSSPSALAAVCNSPCNCGSSERVRISVVAATNYLTDQFLSPFFTYSFT